MRDSLESLVAQWENDRSLLEANELRRRMEVLDRLDAYFPDPEADGKSGDPELVGWRLYQRAHELVARFEAVNAQLYDSIRRDIQQGIYPALLMGLVEGSQGGDPSRRARGMGYDYLDELISGVLQLDEPADSLIHPGPEMVFYQPTPARHIFSLIALANLTVKDVLIDLGSGLGHVPLLVSACTGARAIGIELEPGYVACARRCAERLNLRRISFLEQDAREADLASGTLFYLYTPFTGAMLRAVMDSLRKQAAARTIRVASFGPVTPTIEQEKWLKAEMTPEADQITVFTAEC